MMVLRSWFKDCVRQNGSRRSSSERDEMEGGEGDGWRSGQHMSLAMGGSIDREEYIRDRIQGAKVGRFGRERGKQW